MRIGLTCTTIEPAIAKGQIDGIGTYTKNLYHAYLALDKTVIPYSFPNTKDTLVSSFPNGQFFSGNYTASTIASFLKLKGYRNIDKHIDILHVTDHMLPKVKNVPVIATICDALMFNNNMNWHWNTIRLGNLKKWLRKKTIHWADHFITISNAMVPELVEHIGIKEEKISVIHLGVEKTWFDKVEASVKAEVLKKYNLPSQFILFTGTLQYKKNLPRTIDAYLQLPKDIQDAHPLIIVGRLGWGIEESMAAIQKLTSQTKGRWLDYVNLKDLQILFQCASLYLHPSLHEGFGLTVLEAFASGTPVITSSVTALPEVAGDAAILVDPYSTNEIRVALQNLLTNPGQQQTLIEKGFKRAKAFSWETCASQTLQLYRGFV